MRRDFPRTRRCLYFWIDYPDFQKELQIVTTKVPDASRKLAEQVTAFVQITLEKHDDAKREAFLDCVKAEAHIVECHVMSGSYDFLLKVVAYSMDHFSKLSMQRILKFPGVSNMESHFSLMAVKQDAPLPVSTSSESA